MGILSSESIIKKFSRDVVVSDHWNPISNSYYVRAQILMYEIRKGMFKREYLVRFTVSGERDNVMLKEARFSSKNDANAYVERQNIFMRKIPEGIELKKYLYEFEFIAK